MNKTPTPNNDFDLEGLKTDFPTATELEKFVYDQTDVILNLKGRSNEMKYKVALAVLNGEEVDPEGVRQVDGDFGGPAGTQEQDAVCGLRRDPPTGRFQEGNLHGQTGREGPA